MYRDRQMINRVFFSCFVGLMAALFAPGQLVVAQTQISAAWGDTGEHTHFSVMPNGDLMAIKKYDTGSGTTEVHILTAASHYAEFGFQTATPLGESGAEMDFAAMPNGDLMAILKSETGSGRTEVHILTAASHYSQFGLRTATAFGESGAETVFAVMSNGDLMAIQKSETGSGKTEVHILTAASNYAQVLLWKGTALAESGDEMDFAVMPNRDLMAIKKNQTGTVTTEVHILTAASDYEQFRLQRGTALGESGAETDFAVMPNGDLMAIEKYSTDSGTTEVRILTAASDYAAFLIETVTASEEGGDELDFAVMPNGDLMVLEKYDTDTGTTKVQILTAASNYTLFGLQTGTPLAESGAEMDFAVMPNGDLIAIQKHNTDSGKTEVGILTAASHYAQFRLRNATALGESGAETDFAVMPNGDLIAIEKNATVSGKIEVQILSAASDYSQFRLQTDTALDVSVAEMDFAVMANGDLMAIKKDLTGTFTTEVHILTEASDYAQFRLQTGTALEESGDERVFGVMPNGDLVALQKHSTVSSKTEVQILTAASGYAEFGPPASTGLIESGDEVDFVGMPDGDLMVIKKYNAGTFTTEVHILTAASDYAQFRVQTGTALAWSGDEMDFAVMANGDLMALSKYGTGTGTTEVHILTASSNYTQFGLQTGTALGECGEEMEFAVMANGDLMAIQKHNTDSGKTEVRILTAASGYALFRSQTVSALGECGDEMDFEVMPNGDLVAIRKHGTDSGTTEVQILTAASGYTQVGVPESTALPMLGDDFVFSILSNNDLMAIQKYGAGTGSIEIHLLPL